MDFQRPTFREVRRALKTLESIPRPDGDNEGDPINGETVLPHLSPEHQDQVHAASELINRYVRTFDGQPDVRSLNTLRRNGVPASLHQSQDDPFRLVGRVGDWERSLDVSDPGGAESIDD